MEVSAHDHDVCLPCLRQGERQSLATDPDHRANHRLSHESSRRSHSSYWSEYRRRHPAYAERNRLLQRDRNQKRRRAIASAGVIAKMDALISFKPAALQVNGEYWLIPVIAKMDALRVKISTITGDYD